MGPPVELAMTAQTSPTLRSSSAGYTGKKTEPVDAVSPRLGNVLLFDSWDRPFERTDNGEDKSDCQKRPRRATQACGIWS
jgi:hypothetical protein